MISPFYSKWDSHIFHQYLERFNIPSHLKIKHFSSGMKMKLSLAIALSHHAELFILDEPTAGLDPIVRNEVLEILQQELIDENKTVLFLLILFQTQKNSRLSCIYKTGNLVLEGYCDDIKEKYFIVKGDNKDLDDELNQLLLYKEEKHTGYVGFTKHGQAFKELFGKQVEIKHPTIEELMIYLEKMKETNDVETQNRNGLMT